MIIKTEKLYCVLHSETGTVRIKREEIWRKWNAEYRKAH